MDFFKVPQETVETKKEIAKPTKHYKRFGTKKPIEKFIMKKLNWREHDL